MFPENGLPVLLKNCYRGSRNTAVQKGVRVFRNC